MLEFKNPKIAVPIVLFAGLIWSFGPLVVRYMDDPHLIPWQYIFGRGLTIFILLNLYLYFEEGKNFYKNYYKMGISGLIGGSGLGIAMISFMFSITNTSAAITLLCLAAMPFFTALLAFLFLKEKISLNVWISILIATIGIGIMAVGNTSEASLIGFVFGMTSSIGFAVFSVSLRWRKETLVLCRFHPHCLFFWLKYVHRWFCPLHVAHKKVMLAEVGLYRLHSRAFV